MGRTFINKISDFLDDKGLVLSSLSAPSKKLCKNLSLIIESLSAPSQGPIKISCWSQVQAKRCKGRIDASLDCVHMHIHWHCLLCGNHGLITHWKGTQFDKSYSPPTD